MGIHMDLALCEVGGHRCSPRPPIHPQLELEHWRWCCISTFSQSRAGGRRIVGEEGWCSVQWQGPHREPRVSSNLPGQSSES